MTVSTSPPDHLVVGQEFGTFKQPITAQNHPLTRGGSCHQISQLILLQVSRFWIQRMWVNLYMWFGESSMLAKQMVCFLINKWNWNKETRAPGNLNHPGPLSNSPIISLERTKNAILVKLCLAVVGVAWVPAECQQNAICYTVALSLSLGPRSVALIRYRHISCLTLLDDLAGRFLLLLLLRLRADLSVIFGAAKT